MTSKKSSTTTTAPAAFNASADWPVVNPIVGIPAATAALMPAGESSSTNALLACPDRPMVARPSR
eukprot:CAMPEP_0202881796 /NCGR_PEP_ID=MMETSP1391-20130828/37072_1 /ASSEMBLY_ACC=CAM_ASM_000867 /TAXON_ID=1034604 /ORGANISM="Chlamydomonas leiostraca, Strain SAG 11-49" /LENGTH=64 /DNA_ID=CAMNT_0049564531 /DNA_START=111 /DNA_END=305 /DNA_ORIENTATION=+